VLDVIEQHSDDDSEVGAFHSTVEVGELTSARSQWREGKAK